MRATNFCGVLHSGVRQFNSVLQGTPVHIYRFRFIGYTFNRKYSDFILPCYHCFIKHVLHILRRSYLFYSSLKKFIHCSTLNISEKVQTASIANNTRTKSKSIF